jgi:hypothetical protein
MSANLHERDFHAWTQQQLALLRTGDFSKVDIRLSSGAFPRECPYALENGFYPGDQ